LVGREDSVLAAIDCARFSEISFAKLEGVTLLRLDATVGLETCDFLTGILLFDLEGFSS
jgi:hypothetical protein